MSMIIKTSYLVTAAILFIVLTWLIVIPDDLIRSKIEDSISDSIGHGFNASINGLRKTLFFSIHADSLVIKIAEKEIIKISGLTMRFNPLYLFKKRLRLYVNGKVGDGEVYGDLIPPEKGILNINRVELNAITYLNHMGFKGNGHLSGDIHLKDNNIYIKFEMPDLNIINPGDFFFPLADTFHGARGAMTIHGDMIGIDSIGLEGEKGYARIKGNINEKTVNLTLELMPYPDRLTQVESMLISKYQVSPGYYVIPLKGKLRSAP